MLLVYLQHIYTYPIFHMYTHIDAYKYPAFMLVNLFVCVYLRSTNVTCDMQVTSALLHVLSIRSLFCLVCPPACLLCPPTHPPPSPARSLACLLHLNVLSVCPPPLQTCLCCLLMCVLLCRLLPASPPPSLMTPPLPPLRKPAPATHPPTPSVLAAPFYPPTSLLGQPARLFLRLVCLIAHSLPPSTCLKSPCTTKLVLLLTCLLYLLDASPPVPPRPSAYLPPPLDCLRVSQLDHTW